MKCKYCGAPIEDGKCVYCGQYRDENLDNDTPYTISQNSSVTEKQIFPEKSKKVAILLAFFLGGLGIHKFYLGNAKKGILYLLFCWTYIPSIIGAMEALLYFCMKDEDFEKKYHVKLK